MNTNKIAIGMLLCLVTYSCKNTGQIAVLSLEAPIVIDIKKIVDLKFDTISNKHVSYIPLETNDNCLIGDVEKIIVRHNKIYIADFTAAKALFVFDLQGKLLFKIDRKGKGPGEYIHFHDFDVDSNGSIYMWDVDLCKFLVFDSNGLYIQELNMKFRADYFCLMDQSIYFSQVSEHGGITNLMNYALSTQTSTKLIDNRGLYDNNLVNSSFYKFYYSPSNTCYAPRFSEIIYSINDEGISPYIKLINLPIPPENVIDEWSRHPRRMIDDTDYLKDITYIFESEDYISLNLAIGLHFNLIYDKKSRKGFRLAPLYQSTGIPHIVGTSGNRFIGILTPNKKYLSHILSREQSLSGLTEESNPVVVLFDFSIFNKQEYNE